MPDVINLGQFGAPHNPWEGLADNFAAGMKLGETKRSNLATEKQNKINSEITAANNKATLTAALAKEQFDQDSKNKQMAMEKYKQFSLVYAQMPDDKKKLFEQSDSGREYYTYTKKYLGPEFVDDTNKTVLHLPAEKVYEDQIKKNLASVQKAVLEGNATPEQMQYASIFHNNPNNINVAAQAVTSVMADPMIDKSDPVAVSNAVGERSKAIIEAQKILNRRPGDKAQQEINPRDPMGIYPDSSNPLSQSLGGM